VPKASPKSVFGRAVRALRKERGYSQEELAERAGLHRNYVGGVERGERNVALENIVKERGYSQEELAERAGLHRNLTQRANGSSED
jgi:transcriptional regulator with XRE-family HTH domain